MLLKKLSYLLFTYRKTVVFVFVLYAFLAIWQATKVRLAFNAGKVLPITDSAFVRYVNFKNTFGEDGRVMVVGIQTQKLFQFDLFNDWMKLSNQIKTIQGVEEVVSLGRLYQLQKDTLLRKFIVTPLQSTPLKNQAQADSLHNKIAQIPFYIGLIYQPQTQATLMAITFDAETYNSPKRIAVIKEIQKATTDFSTQYKTQVHYSGLPYIRTEITNLVSKEFVLFLMLSVLIAMLILYLFFRSFSVVIISLIAVSLGVFTALATMTLLGYQITLLTGLIPPIIVVIGIPNSILLLNKYHVEYKASLDKIEALRISIQRIGFTTFIANLTTAIGFGVLALTGSEILMEFGIIASLNIMLTYAICLIIIPLIFSFLAPPEIKHIRHLDNKYLSKIVRKINYWVHSYRPRIYGITIALVFISLFGIYKINANGYVVDDLPKNSPLLKDLKFFEHNFDGALPFEVSIDARKKNAIMRPSTIRKVDELERMLSKYPELSKPVSLNTALKYANQTFYGGDPSFYRTPSMEELPFIADYLKQGGKRNPLMKSFLDSNKQKTRISFQMRDAGSKRINELLAEVTPKIEQIFPPEKYQVDITGSSIIFVKGTNYLLNNLRDSLLLAIALISLVMWMLFRGFKMILISLLPNLIPLMITAAIMGFLGINLKPSTILIFSIALGIASDQTIYFLTRYRYDLKNTAWTISKIITDTLNETGVSMIYTATILFFGFGIFSASSFGGTVALGLLLSITLLLAVISNLILLPSLLLSLEERNAKKRNKE